MKAKEEKTVLLGLQEINDSEKNEVEGGTYVSDILISDILGPIIYCCMDIPPMDILKKPWEW